MSQRLQIVNALVSSMGRKKNVGSVKIKFQLTQAVTDALEWPQMPEGTAEWVPEVDELQASMIELTPNNPELKAVSCTIDTSTIGDFMVQRKKKKDGKNSVKANKTITEVICTVKFADPLGCAKLEQYMQRAARSEMLVIYTPQPTQDELPGTRVDMSPGPVIDGRVHASDDQEQAVLEMPEGEGNRPTHADKVKERRAETARKSELRKASAPAIQ